MKFHVDMISRVLQLKLNATGYKDHWQKKKKIKILALIKHFCLSVGPDTLSTLKRFDDWADRRR